MINTGDKLENVVFINEAVDSLGLKREEGGGKFPEIERGGGWKG